MRISDWSSDVCSSDLHQVLVQVGIIGAAAAGADDLAVQIRQRVDLRILVHGEGRRRVVVDGRKVQHLGALLGRRYGADRHVPAAAPVAGGDDVPRWRDDLQLGAQALGDLLADVDRSEEHQTERKSLMRISYAGFYL